MFPGYSSGSANAPGQLTPRPNTITTKLQRVTTPPIWIRFKKRLNISNRTSQEMISRTQKLLPSLVLSAVRSLEGTRVCTTSAESPNDPYTQNAKPSLYDISKRLPNDVCRLQK